MNTLTKVLIGVLALITLFVAKELFAGNPGNYIFPLEIPVKINGKIVTTSWYSKMRTENGKTYQYKAVNYPAPYGSPILASDDGVITKHEIAGYEGATITIRYPNGDEFTYCHLSQYETIKGQVRRGQVIGYIGTSGRVTGSHLRLRVERNGERVFVGAKTWGLPVDAFYYSPGNFDPRFVFFYKEKSI